MALADVASLFLSVILAPVIQTVALFECYDPLDYIYSEKVAFCHHVCTVNVTFLCSVCKTGSINWA